MKTKLKTLLLIFSLFSLFFTESIVLATSGVVCPTEGKENVWEIRSSSREGSRLLYTVTPGEGDVLLVETDRETEEYRYEFSGDKEDYRCEIRFPDGSDWNWSQRDGSGTGSGSWYDSHMISSPYPDPDDLCEIIIESRVKPVSFGGTKILAILFLAGAGLFQLLAPQTAWYLSYGWRYKNAEPSEAALVMGRISGVIVLIVAVILLFAF